MSSRARVSGPAKLSLAYKLVSPFDPDTFLYIVISSIAGDKGAVVNWHKTFRMTKSLREGCHVAGRVLHSGLRPEAAGSRGACPTDLQREPPSGCSAGGWC